MQTKRQEPSQAYPFQQAFSRPWFQQQSTVIVIPCSASW